MFTCTRTMLPVLAIQETTKNEAQNDPSEVLLLTSDAFIEVSFFRAFAQLLTSPSLSLPPPSSSLTFTLSIVDRRF